MAFVVEMNAVYKLSEKKLKKKSFKTKALKWINFLDESMFLIEKFYAQRCCIRVQQLILKFFDLVKSSFL